MSALRGSALHLDCFSGIAGDMMLGALLALGVPTSVVEHELARLDVGLSLAVCRVQKHGLAATRVEVLAHGHPADSDDHDHHHEHRRWREIRALLEARLSPAVATRALAIFSAIAEVEARIHGVAVDEVAFHEVGALDSIGDIVGVAAALEWLAPSLVTVGPIALGHGHVHTQHGRLPVPAPATLALLSGFAVEDGGVDKELTTPTGAAICRALAQSTAAFPSGIVHATGLGAGRRELTDRPNVLRIVALAPTASPTTSPPTLWQVETNIDDMNPQLFAPLVDALFAAGARDAWLTPIQMKKGRPATLVSALCDETKRPAIEAALFAGSTTLGVRRFAVTRTELERRIETVATRFGELRVKVAGGERVPEYDDVARLAAAHGLTVKQLYYILLGELGRG